MAATAILDCEKLLPLLHHLANYCQIWYTCCEFNLEYIYDVKNAKFTKIQHKLLQLI